MTNKSNDVVILSAVRTPIGTYKGSLKNIRSDQLGSIVIKEVLKMPVSHYNLWLAYLKKEQDEYKTQQRLSKIRN